MNKNSPTYIFLFITVLSAVFGAGVAVVHFSTQKILDRNEQLHRNRAIARAFALQVAEKTPEAYEQAIKRRLTTTTIESEGEKITVFRHEKTGRIGFVFSGMGFWDVIRGVIVLSPGLKQISNIQFLEQKETPGLGARIEEEWFTEQFHDLNIAWQEPVDQRIIIGGSSGNELPNRVDAVTGATQTSMALMRILNEELAAFKQAYRKNEKPQGKSS
ncbi:MAG: FMN-binding protein [Chitinivibrionales bacterium]|nr:FMN-binding protein [Chitinivibrionales bacterium]MBD3358024.1 FMN-binding protein [Chitinivibrionales bacterium]